MPEVCKPKDIITEAAGRAFDLFARHSRGDVVSYAGIEAVTGIVKDSTHWKALIARLRGRLRRERGIVAWALDNVGYKLLTVEEQVRANSERRRRKASRQLSRDVAELAAIPEAELAGRLREERYRRVENSRAARRKVLQAERIEATLARIGSSQPRHRYGG